MIVLLPLGVPVDIISLFVESLGVLLSIIDLKEEVNYMKNNYMAELSGCGVS